MCIRDSGQSAQFHPVIPLCFNARPTNNQAQKKSKIFSHRNGGNCARTLAMLANSCASRMCCVRWQNPD
eukprot:4867069-Pyramimonas_sp.AAC.1